jgi:hypothetical protein
VRVRRRPQWQQLFLEALRSSGNVRSAAAVARIHRSTAYTAAARSPAFAAAWAEAEQDAVDLLEAVVWDAAVGGDAASARWLLAHLRPEKYANTVEVRFGIRKEIERVASRLGRPVDEVLEVVERKAKEILP